MSKLKDVHRRDPIISSGAAKQQQEVVRSMLVLHNMHAPMDAPTEIPLHIFEYAKAEVTYFNKVSNIGRPPVCATVLDLNPDDNVTTLRNKKLLSALRGRRLTGGQAQQLACEDAQTLKKWFVEEGACLVRAGIIKLNLQSNGYSIDKFPVPEEAIGKQAFELVLKDACNMSLQEYEASLLPPEPKRMKHALSADVATAYPSSPVPQGCLGLMRPMHQLGLQAQTLGSSVQQYMPAHASPMQQQMHPGFPHPPGTGVPSVWAPVSSARSNTQHAPSVPQHGGMESSPMQQQMHPGFPHPPGTGVASVWPSVSSAASNAQSAPSVPRHGGMESFGGAAAVEPGVCANVQGLAHAASIQQGHLAAGYGACVGTFTGAPPHDG